MNALGHMMDERRFYEARVVLLSHPIVLNIFSSHLTRRPQYHQPPDCHIITHPLSSRHHSPDKLEASLKELLPNNDLAESTTVYLARCRVPDRVLFLFSRVP